MSSSNEIGAALVESVVVIVAMVALMVALPMLSKYQDIRQSTLDASRYATWQMTVAEEPSRELIIDRFYKDPSSPIRSALSENSVNPYWRHSNLPLVREQAFTPVTRSVDSIVGTGNDSGIVELNSLSLQVADRVESTGQISELATRVIRQVSGWLGESDAIASNRGIVSAAVSIGVSDGFERASSGSCSEGASGCVTASTAILIDGWEAADDLETRDGAEVLVPTTLLKPVGRLLSVVGVVPLLKEFKEIDRSFGCINSTSIPTKELTGELQAEGGDSHAC